MSGCSSRASRKKTRFTSAAEAVRATPSASKWFAEAIFPCNAVNRSSCASAVSSFGPEAMVMVESGFAAGVTTGGATFGGAGGFGRAAAAAEAEAPGEAAGC